MGKVKEFIKSPKATAAAFALAMVLLLFSSVGGARAALTYYSENYTSRVQMENIGVTLVENGEAISNRDYKSASDGTWDENTGTLLGGMLAEGEEVKLGKRYREELNVRNSGTIDQYVRVNVYKYWLDKDGEKQRGLSPGLIGLNFVNIGSDWLVDEDASTTERTVLYYSRLLKAGEESPLFADSLAIDSIIGSKVTQTTTKEGKYTTIKTTFDYDGVKFCVEARVDAVQDHNAEEVDVQDPEVPLANQNLGGLLSNDFAKVLVDLPLAGKVGICSAVFLLGGVGGFVLTRKKRKVKYAKPEEE